MAVGDHGIRVDAGGNRLAISRRGQLNRLVDTALYQRQCDQSELEVVDDVPVDVVAEGQVVAEIE